MLGCITLFCVLLVVRAQEAFYDGYAYTKVMADCLGQEVYHQHLKKVANARRQCNILPSSTDFLFSTSGSFIPVFTIPQNRRKRQLGGVSRQQTGVFPQQIFVQHPGIFSQRPGVFSQQPGVFSQQPGVFSQQPRVFSQQPGVFSRHPGVFVHQPGVLSQEPRIFSHQPRPFTPQSGLFPQQPGVQGTTDLPQPHIFTHLPDSQRWAAVLGPREILEAKEEATALLGNLTCVLSHLGMVNSQLEINFGGLTTNIFNMAIDNTLKDDFISSIEYCRDLTLCLPVKHQTARSHQLQQLLAFLKCEKEARLMACLKHDLKKSINFINLQDSGDRTIDLDNLLDSLVTAKSANELQLLVELEAL